MTQNTNTVEYGEYSKAIGRTELKSVVIAVERVEALASTLNFVVAPKIGEALLPGWHWLFFNPFPARKELGSDGHQKRGSFIPDIKLPRRMWAGGRIFYHNPVQIGSTAARKSEIINVVSKTGRAGKLVFVTLRHTIKQKNVVCLVEEQDIVFKEASKPDASRIKSAHALAKAEWSEEVLPNTTLLFRYSALTSNGHRIHYDQSYAKQEEGYRDLVVHGPLIATLLQELALRCRPDVPMSKFEFRGIAPLFVDRSFHIEAAPQATGNGLNVWARGPEGELAMKAEAEFDSSQLI